MAMQGKVYQQTESELATIRITEQATQRLIEVLIGANVVIKFPMILGVDTNEIALRTANVINQTGFTTNPVRCEVTAS
jgi:hypothetical protein